MINILFIPKPLPEESPTSLLKRMAIRHGCTLRSDLQALLGRTGHYRSILTRTHPIIQGVARKAGIDAESFLSGFYEAIGPLSTAPPLKISGLVVKSRMIRKTSAAFCSECGEGSHEYFIKDLILSVYCPYHLRKYLAKCPHCKASLHWPALLTGGCLCKRPLISPSCTPEEAEIEIKLLSLFRSGDPAQFKKFERYLFLLGYRRTNKSECPMTRTIVALAFSLLERDKEAVFYNLRKLHSLYPDIPQRILCAKLSRIPGEQIQNWLKDFLRQNRSDIGHRKNSKNSEPLTLFTLSRAQICAWLKLGAHHWRLLKCIVKVPPHNTRYTWSQAQTLAENTLNLKFHNGFSQKKIICGLSINYIKNELSLTNKAINGLITEKLLTPISGSRYTSLFDPVEVKTLSTNYISIQRLSASSEISTNRLRAAIEYLDLSNHDFNTRKLYLHVVSTQTGQLAADWCKNCKRQAYTNYPRLTLDKPEQAGVWLSTKETIQTLGVNVHTIRHLIRSGMLKNCLLASNGHGYVIKKEEIERFRSEYIGLTETSRLLNWPLRITRETLKKADITPVIGYESDNKKPFYFLRQQILKYARKLEKLRKSQAAGYTITEVRQKLCLPLPLILSMTKSGIIKFTDPTNRAIQKKCVDEFHDNYVSLPTVASGLNVPASCAYKALARYGIKPLFDTRHNFTRIYQIDDIAKQFSLPQRPNPEKIVKTKKIDIIRVSHFRKQYGVSAVQFGILFIKSGFIKTIEVYGPAYILTEDAKKVSNILDEYLPLCQVVEYFGSQQFARKLITSNKLTTARPLLPYSDHPLITKKSLRDYALTNPLA